MSDKFEPHVLAELDQMDAAGDTDYITLALLVSSAKHLWDLQEVPLANQIQRMYATMASLENLGINLERLYAVDNHLVDLIKPPETT